MLTILSPAKNMRPSTRVVPMRTSPRFLDQTLPIFDTLKSLAPYELESLMHIRSPLALKACDDFAHWQPEGGTPAILSYNGLVYKNLSSDTLDDDALLYAHDHLRILSAFYGVLRPLDTILPYRLEMAQKPSFGSLYAYWGDTFYQDLFSSGEPVINLASKEYSKAVSAYCKPTDRFITCEFLIWRGGKLRALATIAKMARGQMARYIIQNRIDTPLELTNFQWDGFAFEPSLSNADLMTFVQA